MVKIFITNVNIGNPKSDSNICSSRIDFLFFNLKESVWTNLVECSHFLISLVGACMTKFRHISV